MELPEDEVKPGAPEWVVTFGDMMSLLLTFFVLLLSFSSMEASKFKVVAGSMRKAFGLQTKHNYSGIPMGTTIMSTDARKTTDPADQMKLIQSIRQELEKNKMTARGKVEKSEKGVAVRLDGELVFPSASAELREEALPLLETIANLAATRAGVVEVEGHTDNVPIRSPNYPSNWQLSGARAGSAAMFLIDKGVPASRVKAVAYADTRPIAGNDTPEGRAQNRRVEFLFVDPVEGGAGEAIEPPQPSTGADDAQG